MMQVLDEEARNRLANIKAVNEAKAEAVENIIIGNIQRGAVTGKITNQMLVELLEQYSEKMAEYDKENKVEFKRKAFDSDDDIDIDNLDLWRQVFIKPKDKGD